MIQLDQLHRVAAAVGDPAAPAYLYETVGDALAILCGWRLYTLLTVTPDGTEVERIHTSDPAAYPLQGRKRMGPTPWGAHVLKGQRPWMCNDADGIRWAFPDHELIASLGCESSVNVPVLYAGRTLGTLNILDRAGAYTPEKMDTATLFAAFLTPAYLQATAPRP